MKTNYLKLLICLILAIAGTFVRNFWGGVFSGFFLCLVVLSSIGLTLAYKAAKRMNAARRRDEDEE